MLSNLLGALIAVLLVSSYYPTLLQVVTSIIGRRTCENICIFRRETKKGGRLIVLLPVKREPVDLIREFLEKNRPFLRRASLVYIVAEGYSDSERSSLERMTRQIADLEIKLLFQHGSRNKAQALNRALALLQLSDQDVVMVLDVDSRVRSIPEHLPDVATPVWRGYTRIRSMLGLGQVIGYHYYEQVMRGLGSASGWRPLLGSGLTVRMGVLRRLGMFNEDVILEDVELSLRALYAGYTVAQPADLVVEVQVPSTYSSFVRQQCRWAYGTMQLVRRYLRLLLRRPLVLLYLLQYVSYPSHMLLACTVYASCLLDVTPPLSLQLSLLVLVYVLLCAYTYVLCRLTPPTTTIKEKLVALNRVNMAYVLVAPRLLVDIARGLLGLEYRWIPTPKLERIDSWRHRASMFKIELVQSLTFAILPVLCLATHGIGIFLSNPLSLLALAYTASAVWGYVRAVQRDLA